MDPEIKTSSGSLRAYLFDSWVVFLSPKLNRTEHRHGVMQLSISLTDTSHRVGAGGRNAVDAQVHLVGPNCPHSLECDSQTLVAWIEPESDLGRRLAHAYLADSAHATPDAELHRAAGSPELLRALAERWPAEAFRPIGEQIYGRLTAHLGAPPHVVHPAVRKALRLIREDPAEKRRAAALAQQLGISESRFLHLFSEHVGVPFRAYLRWRRVFGALALIVGKGSSATDAAAVMGFSDSAHLTRVMNDFLAISPSRYAKHSYVSMEIVDCTRA